MANSTPNLELAMVGNCCISALIDSRARIVWSCFPRFDGDPVFHALIGATAQAPEEGVFAIELDGIVASKQSYLHNTAVVRTTLESVDGAVEITDFAPRFYERGRSFRPHTLIRRIRPIRGSPRVRLRAALRFEFGRTAPTIATGSNHVRFIGPQQTLRLTTDAPIDYLVQRTPFLLEGPIDLILGPDETLAGGVHEVASEFEERTIHYWQTWVHRLALPLEWQDAVIRAAITLKLSSYEPTGAIVAAMTTSIPEAPGSGRNWDYRFCWIRDAVFVVRALNSLSSVHAMEQYFRWLMNIVAGSSGGRIQPVYGIGLEGRLDEHVIDELPGYRGMGPVRVGNLAYAQDQHDTYGNLILGTAQAFFDRRLYMSAGEPEFARLEVVGEAAFKFHAEPDSGMWELRSRTRCHTSTATMCWAGCDRLAKIAAHLGHGERAEMWRGRADKIKVTVLERSWSQKRRSFVESFEGEHLDAAVLLMLEVGLIEPTDPRFVSTVNALETNLSRGAFMMRYEEADDIGLPETAFNLCAFWRLEALARIGRRDEARLLFNELLAVRNSLGLLSEDTDCSTGEAWGNFPQTYSMVGIINGAMRLSKPWETAI